MWSKLKILYVHFGNTKFMHINMYFICRNAVKKYYFIVSRSECVWVLEIVRS